MRNFRDNIFDISKGGFNLIRRRLLPTGGREDSGK